MSSGFDIIIFAGGESFVVRAICELRLTLIQVEMPSGGSAVNCKQCYPLLHSVATCCIILDSYGVRAWWRVGL